ncbi:MAG TPA: hypothetical protein VK982_00640 [Bacteroidales bacterium]|nr:hypothetical protein [Bacteroidales bacterium]
MKERLLFVCVGQGGGNIGQLFEAKGYNCYFINTSYDDLVTIEAKHKYHIPGGNGCNKNRQKALQYAKDYYDNMINLIDEKFPMQDIVYFIYTLGGGSGGGLSPILLDLISKKNPDKHYGAINILPNINEPIKCQINAAKAFQQTENIEDITILTLDNNTIYDKFKINFAFYSIFDCLMNITNPDPRGIIDGAELETLLTCSGHMYISLIDSWNYINDSINKNIFTPFDEGCRYITTTSKDKFNIENIINVFGKPIDTFQGYNNNYNMIIASGMPTPTRVINKIIEKANQENNEQKNNSNQSNKIQELKINLYNNIKTIDKKEIDIESIFQKYAN